MKIQKYGLLILRDQYFSDFPFESMMSNKYESRPYYLAVQERSGIIWVVPLSSQIDKYKAAIQKHETARGAGTCIYYHIAKIMGEESAFLIGDMIPVSENYIKKPFTLRSIPYVMENKTEIKSIQKKVSKYLALVRNGKLTPYVDILKIEQSLLAKL